MATAKTWIIIILSVIAACVIAVIGLAVAGGFWVAQHIRSSPATAVSAGRSFDETRGGFTSKPLLELDEFEHPRINVRVSELPSSPAKPTDLHVMVWESEKGQMIRITIPFWILRLGRQKFNLFEGRNDVSLEDLHLDMKELERIGPQLVLDFRAPAGNRVMIWTK